MSMFDERPEEKSSDSHWGAALIAFGIAGVCSWISHSLKSSPTKIKKPTKDAIVANALKRLPDPYDYKEALKHMSADEFQRNPRQVSFMVPNPPNLPIYPGGPVGRLITVPFSYLANPAFCTAYTKRILARKFDYDLEKRLLEWSLINRYYQATAEKGILECTDCFTLYTRKTFNGPDATTTQQYYCRPCKLDMYIKYISTLFMCSEKLGWYVPLKQTKGVFPDYNDTFIPNALNNPKDLNRILCVPDIDPIIEYIDDAVKFYTGDILERKLTIDNIMKEVCGES